MDAWFLVQKELRQMIGAFSPINLQVMTQERNQHGSNSEIQPTCLYQTSHGRIDDRDTGLSSFPGL